MILLVLPAFAGLLDALSDADRHLETCKLAAEDAEAKGEIVRVHGVWKACLGEARRLGYAELEPLLQAEIAVGGARVQAESLRVAEPHRWAMAVLAEAARWSSVEFPSDVVRRTFRSWMGTDEGRAYADPVRSVGVVWESPVAPRDEELLRRYLEDAGLRWATAGSPEVDATVFARLEQRVQAGAGSRQGELQLANTSLVISRVRVRAEDRTLKGFTVSAAAEDADAAAAEERSLRTVADTAAQRLLLRLLGVLFEG